MRVDLAALVSAWPFLMTGLWFTLQITVVGVAGGIIFGCRGTDCCRALRPPMSI